MFNMKNLPQQLMKKLESHIQVTGLAGGDLEPRSYHAGLAGGDSEPVHTDAIFLGGKRMPSPPQLP